MGEIERLERFDDVDATGEAERFVAFLDRIDALPDVTARRQRSYALLGAGPVVDVGCGTGAATRELAARDGSAIGVDLSEAMIAVARERAVDGARFEVAAAEALPLDDASVAGYRAERVFQHLANAADALAEARRVLVPGGRIVLIDQDWDLLAFASDDPLLERTIVSAFSDSLVAGRAGRDARERLLAAGFEDVTVEADAVISTEHDDYGFVAGMVAAAAVAAGAVDQATADTWLADQEQRSAEGRFLMTMVHMLASASRP